MTGTYDGITTEQAAAQRRIASAGPELLAGCKWFMAEMANGNIVRNITADGQSDYLARMVQLARDLQRVQAAIDRAEGL